MKIKIEKWLIRRNAFGGEGDYIVIECSDINKALDNINNAIKKIDEYEIDIEE
jgi:hypothetical protein